MDPRKSHDLVANEGGRVQTWMKEIVYWLSVPLGGGLWLWGDRNAPSVDIYRNYDRGIYLRFPEVLDESWG